MPSLRVLPDSCFVRSRHLRPARYSCAWIGRTSTSTFSIGCFATAIFPKLLPFIYSFFSNMLMNFCRYSSYPSLEFINVRQSDISFLPSSLYTSKCGAARSSRSSSLWHRVIVVTASCVSPAESNDRPAPSITRSGTSTLLALVIPFRMWTDLSDILLSITWKGRPEVRSVLHLAEQTWGNLSGVVCGPWTIIPLASDCNGTGVTIVTFENGC